MRLTPQDTDAIIQTLASTSFRPSSLFLFGSRTQDQLKGGDVDLLYIVSQTDLEAATAMKWRLLNNIKKKTGDRKIDLVIATPQLAKNDPFLSGLLPEAVLLQQWD